MFSTCVTSVPTVSCLTVNLRTQIGTFFLWCCLRAVWTLPLTTTGPICLHCFERRIAHPVWIRPCSFQPMHVMWKFDPNLLLAISGKGARNSRIHIQDGNCTWRYQLTKREIPAKQPTGLEPLTPILDLLLLSQRKTMIKWSVQRKSCNPNEPWSSEH